MRPAAGQLCDSACRVVGTRVDGAYRQFDAPLGTLVEGGEDAAIRPQGIEPNAPVDRGDTRRRIGDLGTFAWASVVVPLGRRALAGAECTAAGVWSSQR